MSTNPATLKALKKLKKKIEDFQDGLKESVKFLSWHIGQQERQKTHQRDWRTEKKRKKK